MGVSATMKTRWFLAVACAMTVGFAPVRASSDSAAPWRAFFQIVIPAATNNFTSLRGAFDPTSANYAVKAPFFPQLVRGCIVFVSGAGDSQAWNLRCQLKGYSGEAVGPATHEGPLEHDLSSALPRFELGRNVIGEPQWKIGSNTAVTIVFGGILVTHGYTGI